MARKAKIAEKLTEASIKARQPAAARYDVWDEDVRGLVLRVSPTGHKSFSVFRRVKNGRPERVTIGPWPDVSLRDARDKARTVIGHLAMGTSEAEKRRELRRESTLGELWELFLQQHAKIRKRSWRTDEKRWKCHLAQFAHEPLSRVTTERVSRWLAKIAAGSGHGAANRTRALLMTMFSIGRKQFGLKIGNPVKDTPRAREMPKDRFLAPDELARFLTALDAYPEADARDFYWLALFTGQRSGTIARMRWCDLNLKDGIWSIPADDMKAGRPHTIPLSRATVQRLEQRYENAASVYWVFPSSRREGHIEPPRHAWKRLMTAAAITPPATPHDLRRTFATVGVEAGVGLGEISKLLGHSPVGGITSIYAKTPMSTLMRAVERIATAILATREPSGDVLTFPDHGAQEKA